MTDVVSPAPGESINGSSLPQPAPTGQTRSGMTAESIRAAVSDHLLYSIARPSVALTPEHYYRALSLAVRDRMQSAAAMAGADEASESDPSAESVRPSVTLPAL